MSQANTLIDRLKSLKDEGRLPHALLFCGDDVDVLQEHSQDFIQYVLCRQKSSSQACQSCVSCQKFARRVHPDLLIIEPEKKEIKIDQIRKAIQWIQLSPNESEEKFCVVTRADVLNRSAANSFLKTLEEPPPHGKIILITRMSDHLLPTIRSRVQMFRFPTSRDPARDIQEQRPQWMDELDEVLDGRADASKIFELTADIANDREELLAFFERVQRKALEELKKEQGASIRYFRRLEELYDLGIRLEGQLLRGYGNTALALDRWLLKWNQLHTGPR